MDFSHALSFIRGGRGVARAAWSNNNKYVALCRQSNVIPNPVDVQINTPFIYQIDKFGDVVPWIPTMKDLLADDWLVRGRITDEGVLEPEQLGE